MFQKFLISTFKKLSRKKNKKGDYFLIIAAVLLMVVSAAAIFYFSSKEAPSAALAPKMEITGRITLTIDFGGKQLGVEGDVIKGETLFDVLSQTAKTGNFRFKLDKKNNIAAIETFAAGEEKSWYWYLNGKRITGKEEINFALYCLKSLYSPP